MNIKTNAQTRFTIPAAPALALVPPLMAMMTSALVPLGTSNVLVPPQLIYQLAFEQALRDMHREQARINFHRDSALSDN
jgi:hypothetical protein